MSFAARVLDGDLERHGRRFVLIEFAPSAVIATCLAAAVVPIAIARSDVDASTLVAAVFFAGVALNAAAAARWLASREPDQPSSDIEIIDLVTFGAATLSPGADLGGGGDSRTTAHCHGGGCDGRGRPAGGCR
jgi:hypothetical protein